MIYDKASQLIDKKFIKPETRNITGSLIRVEYRLQNPIVVNRELGLGTISDLIDNWNNLKGLYNESVGSFLHRFEQKIPKKIQSFKSESDVLKYFFNTYPNSGWNQYRNYYDSRAILGKWGSINDLRLTLSTYRKVQELAVM